MYIPPLPVGESGPVVLLRDVPPLPDGFGEPASVEDAARALSDNERCDGDDDNTGQPAAPNEVADTEAPTLAPVPAVPSQVKRGPGRPRKTDSVPDSAPRTAAGTSDAGAAAAAEKVSRRAVKRLKRSVLEDRYLSLHERAAHLEAETAELNRRVAVVQAVGTDVIEDGVRNMVGELVDLADNGAQLMVAPKLAPVIALDADERARLVKLGAPLAKMQLGAYVEKSPLISFVLCVGSIALGKYVAYKLAASEPGAVGTVGGSPAPGVSADAADTPKRGRK